MKKAEECHSHSSAMGNCVSKIAAPTDGSCCLARAVNPTAFVLEQIIWDSVLGVAPALDISHSPDVSPLTRSDSPSLTVPLFAECRQALLCTFLI
jgi:hypothetical protein